MPRVGYSIPMQGFRPKTDPQKAMAGLGLRGLGDSNTFSGCVQGFDANSNPVSCNDPSAVVWMDANGNAVPAGSPAAAIGGAPTGSILLYQGQFQVTPTLNVNTIIARVSAAVRSYGLQVLNSQNDGGAFTIGNFNVSFTLQVTGSGFASPSDAGSIVDHAYYTTVGRMPVFSSTLVQSAPGSPVPTLLPPNMEPGGINPPPSSLTSWLEQNAMWLGLGVLAVAVLPTVVKKL